MEIVNVTQRFNDKAENLRTNLIDTKEMLQRDMRDQINATRKWMEQQLSLYVPKRIFNTEIESLRSDLEKLGKEMESSYTTKTELKTVISGLSTEVKSNYDELLNSKRMSDKIQMKIDELFEMLDKDQEQFEAVRLELHEVDIKLQKKAGFAEFVKLKHEQSRFALYEDLKDLHNKVVPPI